MNLIFDFDGTLADSIDEVLLVANQYIKITDGVLVSKEEVKAKGVRAVIASRKVSRLQLIVFLIIGRQKLARLVETLDIFPDLSAAIKALSKNHRLGILTSNSKLNVEKFLKYHGLEKYFDFIESEFSFFGKDRKLRKLINSYNLDKKITYYIGDETRDIIAAKKANIKSVAVTWGFEGKDLLLKQKPNKIISKPLQLIQIFRS